MTRAVVDDEPFADPWHAHDVDGRSQITAAVPRCEATAPMVHTQAGARCERPAHGPEPNHKVAPRDGLPGAVWSDKPTAADIMAKAAAAVADLPLLGASTAPSAADVEATLQRFTDETAIRVTDVTVEGSTVTVNMLIPPLLAVELAEAGIIDLPAVKR